MQVGNGGTTPTLLIRKGKFARCKQARIPAANRTLANSDIREVAMAKKLNWSRENIKKKMLINGYEYKNSDFDFAAVFRRRNKHRNYNGGFASRLRASRSAF
jgi:hypothetical protein